MRHTPNEIWSEILENLNDTAQQDVYLHQAVPLSLTADALKIAVPSAYTRARIEERFPNGHPANVSNTESVHNVYSLSL